MGSYILFIRLQHLAQITICLKKSTVFLQTSAGREVLGTFLRVMFIFCSLMCLVSSLLPFYFVCQNFVLPKGNDTESTEIKPSQDSPLMSVVARQNLNGNSISLDSLISFFLGLFMKAAFVTRGLFCRLILLMLYSLLNCRKLVNETLVKHLSV